MRNDLLTFLANSLLIGEHDLDASKIKKLTMVTICNKQIFSYSERLNEKLIDAKIHTDILGSDHCPIELDIDL